MQINHVVSDIFSALETPRLTKSVTLQVEIDVQSDFKNVCMKLRAGDSVPVLVSRKVEEKGNTMEMVVVMFQVGAKEVAMEEVFKVRREFGGIFFPCAFCSLAFLLSQSTLLNCWWPVILADHYEFGNETTWRARAKKPDLVSNADQEEESSQAGFM